MFRLYRCQTDIYHLPVLIFHRLVGRIPPQVEYRLCFAQIWKWNFVSICRNEYYFEGWYWL